MEIISRYRAGFADFLSNLSILVCRLSFCFEPEVKSMPKSIVTTPSNGHKNNRVTFHLGYYLLGMKS
jgi:hypothetical protein